VLDLVTWLKVQWLSWCTASNSAIMHRLSAPCTCLVMKFLLV
jgi:hypothetical protein